MLETIYNDFTTKLLPQIQQGLVITKDYFTDLFSRYVHYLFITDLISSILCLVGAVILFFVLKKVWNYGIQKDDYGDYKFEDEVWPLFVIILGGIAFFSMLGFSIDSAMNVVKDKYVPEIRVMEKIQEFRQTK